MDDAYEQQEETQSSEPEVPALIFEELTLAELLRYLVWRPGRTLGMLWQVLVRSSERGDQDEDSDSPDDYPPDAPRGWDEDEVYIPEDDTYPPVERVPFMIPARINLTPGWIIVLAVAVLLAIWGGNRLYNAATDLEKHIKRETNGAAVPFALAGMVYIGFVVVASRQWWARQLDRVTRRFPTLIKLRRWRVQMALTGLTVFTLFLALINLGSVGWSVFFFVVAAGIWALLIGLSTTLEPVESSPAIEEVPIVQAPSGFWPWFQANAFRLILIPVALLLSGAAYFYNVKLDPVTDEVTDIVLTGKGLAAWVGSVMLWGVILLVGQIPLSFRLPLPVRRGAIHELPLQIDSTENGEQNEPHPQPLSSQAREGRNILKGWWVAASLAAVIALGAYFRLHELASTPPEMTSDHIEKLLDAIKVDEGNYGVFFPNNGGREGFQMYVVALIANLGEGFTFNALKLATVIEGLLTLPALWWMARQIFGRETEDSRRLGNWVGLALAGLVAISYWHEMLSRLGLRIVLTPLTTALVIGLMARVMRRSRLVDYVALGFVLGAGVYFYQANRMLPLVAVAGFGLMVLYRMRQPRDVLRLGGSAVSLLILIGVPVLVYWYMGELLTGYSKSQELGTRMGDLMPLFVMVWFSILVIALRPTDPVLLVGRGAMATAVIALAVYVPMYHYSQIRSEEFWERTRGRMFGEEAFKRPDAHGVLVTYEPTLSEQAERFWDQRDVFVQNYRNALRMYHWEGDGQWINNADSLPAMDGATGGLVILGLLVWGVLIFQRRDPVLWLVPVGVLVMLLPSSMTLAFPNENPNFTRASGTIPLIFWLAALPLGLLAWYVQRLPWNVRGVPVGVVVGVVLIGGVLGDNLGPNWDNYFTQYRLNYSYSWKPYREISKPLRAFAHGEGSFGNAFYVHYEHWLDHRILGGMAGDIRWPNGLVTREEVYTRVGLNRGTPYQFDPTKPAFFMINEYDQESIVWFQTNFPGGTLELYTYTYDTNHGEQSGQFFVYTVWTGALE
ncbi:MAG TPA: hypothetical protein VHP83_00660 [Aggregatilineaceae bacterium]|nr:hypothetical protein [Aggregatilineaceae bacterium]